jgi:site-specific DNA-methyltransferase (adenine-specific)
VIEFGVVERGTLHPTQKPVPLFEYLIKTYTNEGDLVLDNCAGSFTTAIAAINTNRKCICIEKDDKYFEIGKKRVEDALNIIKNTPVTQSLFS